MKRADHDLKCLACHAPVTVTSWTGDGPETPEFIQTRENVRVLFANAGDKTQMFAVCSEPCMRKILRSEEVTSLGSGGVVS
jgi:hypothetical protein